MGRKTWIETQTTMMPGGGVPNCFSFVITSNPSLLKTPPTVSCAFTSSYEEAVKSACKLDNPVWVVGGLLPYELALQDKRTSTVVLTTVFCTPSLENEIASISRFPKLDLSKFSTTNPSTTWQEPSGIVCELNVHSALR